VRGPDTDLVVVLDVLDGWASSVAGLHGSPLDGVMLGITTFGEEIVLATAFAVLVLFAYTTRGRSWGRFVVLTGAGALLLDNLIKPLVGRPRPAFDQLVAGTGSSWPSGHVTGTAGLLFALAYLASTDKGRAARGTIWGLAGAGIVLMAASRVYLGVHWPTDVIAGALFGGTWAVLCARWTGIKRTLHGRGEHPYQITLKRRLRCGDYSLSHVSLALSCPLSRDLHRPITTTFPIAPPSASRAISPWRKELPMRPRSTIRSSFPRTRARAPTPP
jgi:membrane-associated phospholipid phosphatase